MMASEPEDLLTRDLDGVSDQPSKCPGPGSIQRSSTQRRTTKKILHWRYYLRSFEPL